MVKKLPANAGDTGDVGSVLESGNSPGEGNGKPLQYTCLGKSHGRGAWWATAHGVTKSQTHVSTRMHIHRSWAVSTWVITWVPL